MAITLQEICVRLILMSVSPTRARTEGHATMKSTDTHVIATSPSREITVKYPNARYLVYVCASHNSNYLQLNQLLHIKSSLKFWVMCL